MVIRLITQRPWPPQPELITADDVVASGACYNGVLDWLNRQPVLLTAVRPSVAISVSSNSEAMLIRKASGMDGNGNIDGDGDGYGESGYYPDSHGDGFGNGNGYGGIGPYAFGDGYGYGECYGDVTGDDNGDGYGYGYGEIGDTDGGDDDDGADGDGDGYGYCYGYGYADGDCYGYVGRCVDWCGDVTGD